MDDYAYDLYFNNEFSFDDFVCVVDSFDTPALVVDTQCSPRKRSKLASPSPKTKKKTYALQIVELKQEIVDLRLEMELREAQILSLIQHKS